MRPREAARTGRRTRHACSATLADADRARVPRSSSCRRRVPERPLTQDHSKWSEIFVSPVRWEGPDEHVACHGTRRAGTSVSGEEMTGPMKAIVMAILGSIVGGCGVSYTGESVSPTEMDQVYCSRSGGIWRAALETCEIPRR